MFRLKTQPPADGVLPNIPAQQKIERYNVFICFAPPDREFVQNLSGALKKRRRLADVEWDTLQGSANAFDQISPRVLATETFLFVASPDSLASPLCQSLLALALKNNKNVVPVLHRDTQLPAPLQNLDVIDYRAEAHVANAFSAVVQAIHTDLNLDVFICYSRRDHGFVKYLYDSFDAIGRTCWMDLTSIPFTGKWKEEVLAGIDAADNFLFVMTPDSVNSKECGAELSHAIARNKRLIPILCSEVDDRDVPAALGEIQRIPFLPPVSYDDAFQNLVNALNHDLDYVRAHKRLLLQTEYWHSNPDDESRLLTGNELKRAEELVREGASKSPKPTARQAHFVIASRLRSNKTQRRRVVLLSVALIVSLAATAFALVQMRVAQAAQKEAERQTTIAQKERDTAEEQRGIAATQGRVAKWQRMVAIGKQREAEEQKKLADEQRIEAQRQRNIANDQTILAKKNEDTAVRQLANNYLGNGLNAERSQDWLSASHYFAKAAQTSRDRDVIERASRDVVRMNEHVSLEYLQEVGPLRSLTVSADWRRLLITKGDSVEIRDAMSGEKISDPLVSGTEYPNAIFSNDGRWVGIWYKTKDDKPFAFLADATTGKITFPLSQGQMSSVLGMHFSKDSALVLTWGMGGAQLWRTSDGSPAAPFMKHEMSWCDPPKPSGLTEEDPCPKEEANREVSIRPVTHAIFTPDEKYVLTTTHYGDARLWLMSDGSAAGPPMKPESGVRSAIVSHDGKLALLLGGAESATATLWRLGDGVQVGAPMEHDGMTNALFSHNDQLVLTWGPRGTARLWHTKNGALAAHTIIHADNVLTAPAFTSDDTQLLTRTEGGYAWNIEALLKLGPPVPTPSANDDPVILGPRRDLVEGPLPDTDVLKGASLVKNDAYVMTWGQSGVALWDRTNQIFNSVTLTPDPVTHAQLSHNNAFLITQNDDAVRLWWGDGSGPASPQMLHSSLSPGDSTEAVVSKDDRYILSWSHNGTIRLWHTNFVKPKPALMSPGALLKGATLVNNDREVVTWEHRELHFWDSSTGKPTGLIVSLPPSAESSETIRGTSFSSDKSIFLTWDKGIIRLFYTKDGSKVREAITPQGFMDGALLSPDGTFLLVWASDGKIRVWDTHGTTNEPRAEMQFDGYLQDVVVSPDSSIVLGSGAASIQLWRSADGRQIGSPLGHEPQVKNWIEGFSSGAFPGAVFSPNSKLVATWARDGASRIIRTADGVEIGRITSNDVMAGATFSDDNNYVLAWSMDGAGHLLRVGESQTRFNLRHTPGHFITAAIITSRTNRIVTFGTDLTTRVWNLNNGRPKTPPMHAMGGQNTPRSPRRYEDSLFGFAGSLSPDGRLILTKDPINGTARLWHMDGSPAGEFQPSSIPTSAVFSSDSRSVLVWGLDGAEIWDISINNHIPVSRLALYLEAVTGTSMNDVGTLNRLSPAEWLKRKHLFERSPPKKPAARKGKRVAHKT